MAAAGWGLAALALTLVACGLPAPRASAPPPLVAPAVLAPPPVPAAAPPAPAVAAFEPALPPGWERLDALARADLAVPAARTGRLTIANPGAADVVLGLLVDPAGGGGGSVATPTPAPSATPTGRRPPFGVRFDASLRPGRRLFAATSAPAPVLGARAGFWVNDGSGELAGDRRRDASLRLVTAHATFYLDDQADVDVDAKQLAALARGFEERVRPPLTRVFGEEDVPGVDGAARIYVVLSPWVGQAPGREGLMGYFWPRDLAAPEPAATDLRAHANQKEVLFLSTAILAEPDLSALGTLAHEYQHLLHQCAKARADGTPRIEETWLDEGLSMLAMDLAGVGLAAGDPFVRDELAALARNPGAYSLTDWDGNPDGRSYGLSYLFVRWLTERHGLGFVQALQAEPAVGIAALDLALRARGSSFEATFHDWSRSFAQGLPGIVAPAPQPLTTPTSLRVRAHGVAPLAVSGPRRIALMRGNGAVSWRLD